MIALGVLILTAVFVAGWVILAVFYHMEADARIRENREEGHRRSVVRAHAMARAIARQAIRRAQINVRYELRNESDIDWGDEDDRGQGRGLESRDLRDGEHH